MATLEQIIGEVRALSPGEKSKLRQVLDSELEQQQPPQSSKPSYRTFERENAIPPQFPHNLALVNQRPMWKHWNLERLAS